MINYLKERYIFILSALFVILFEIYLLSGLNVSGYAIVMITFMFSIVIIVSLTGDYFKKKKFINELKEKTENLDQKYLLSELVDIPRSQYEKELYNILKLCNKSMNDKISEVERESREYIEFIELWVHEVKTPIAAAKLIAENNKNETTLSIKEEIEKIEEFIEKALYYTRSNTVEKDYIIKKVDLEKIINSAIKQDAHSLIENKVRIIKDDLSFDVFTDEKWIEFIIHQIISNAVKYFDKDEKILEFLAVNNKENIVLYIKDNGQGMDEKTIDKAFEKGFTGKTGRIYKNATGIGLYLCRKLCLKMGLDINIKSEYGVFTEISILFPKTNMYTF